MGNYNKRNFKNKIKKVENKKYVFLKFSKFMIDEIILKNNEKIQFNKDDVVIFVGSNNVGKSRMLKDIKLDMLNLYFEKNNKKIIIDNIKYKSQGIYKKKISEILDERFVKNRHNTYNITFDEGEEYHYHQGLEHENKKNILKLFYTFLSTENRLKMTNKICYCNMLGTASYNMWIMDVLYRDKKKIQKLNDYLLPTFGKAIDVFEFNDDSYGKKYKLGSKDEINYTINADTRLSKEKLEKLEDLHEQGDGIRSAVAILTSLIVNENSICLIDEPETFLHPPQAKILGKNIVELSANRQCFVATHNIDIIRGMLENNSERVKIIKVERNNDNNNLYILDKNDVAQIANDRNLKYTNILNGLFYDNVVLCENESDCKFYSYILEMIDKNISQKTLFCAVGGKDQFKIIAPLLKRLRINYKIIADIDLINSKEKLEQLLNAIERNLYSEISIEHSEFIDEYKKSSPSLLKTQKQIKEEINAIFNEDQFMAEDDAKKMREILKNINVFSLLKKAGKHILPTGNCTNNYNKIESFLRSNAIYILGCGEIERLIPEVESHGDKWVENVFKKYYDDNDNVFNEAKCFIKKVFEI